MDRDSKCAFPRALVLTAACLCLWSVAVVGSQAEARHPLLAEPTQSGQTATFRDLFEGEGDLAIPHGVFMLGDGGMLRQLAPLTTDRDALRNAARGVIDAGPSSDSIFDRMSREYDPAMRGALDVLNSPLSSPRKRREVVRSLEQEAQNDGELARQRVGHTLRQLTELTQALSVMEGRTALVWISSGAMISESGPFGAFALTVQEVTAAEMGSSSLTTWSTQDPRMLELIATLVEAANSGNVSIYIIDPRPRSELGSLGTRAAVGDSQVGYPEAYVQSSARHEMDFIAGVLSERGCGKHRLGVEMDSYHFTARAYEQLKLGLPEATFVDANLLVNWVRLVKSQPEIERMREAGRIADRAMQAVIDRIEPGVRECDAAATFYATEISGTESFGDDLPSHALYMPTGERASAPHLSWTDARFKAGEATSIELAGCRHRYHAGLARTVFLGSPAARLTEVAEVVVEGMEAALEKARPGATCEQVEATWRAVITKAGLEKESRIGYSIGIGYPPDWGEHTASLRHGDRTVLRPNMTFHVILGMWMDDWGFELSETIRVADDGAPESFSQLPRKLFVKR